MTQTNTFVSGLSTDISPVFNKDDSYTWALNMMRRTDNGEMGGRASDFGNTLTNTLSDGYSIIGSIPTVNNSFIIFSCDLDGNSHISEFNAFYDETINILIDTKDLGFTTENPVQGIFRLRNGCERVIYFTDRFNSFRVINLDKLDDYKDSNGDWDVSRFKLNRTFDLATIDDITINNSGGSLRVGAYQFTYRYLDFDGNSTNWAPLTPAYYITDDSSSNTFDRINGATDIEFYTSEEGGVPSTSKSIKITMTNVDESYQYIEFSVVRSIQGLGVITDTSIISRKPISNSTLTYLYTANTSEQTASTIDAIIIDKESIETVGTLAQVNSNLYLGNVALKQHDWAGFQRAASKITTSLKVTKVKAYDPKVTGNPKNGAESLSFVDDEVYALGIVYIMKDGTYSPAFHIPGRAALTNERNLITSWDANISPWAIDTTELQNTYAQNETETTDKQVLRRFHVYVTGSSTNLAYYESLQLYPNLYDCNNESVWGVDANGIKLEGKNIRYHKLPSRAEVPLVEQVLGEWYINKLGFEFSNVDLPSDDVQSYFFVQARQSEQDRTVLDQGMLNTTKRNNGKLFSEGFQQYDTYLPEVNTGANRHGGRNTEVLCYNSARTLSEKRAIPHDYIKVHSFYDNPVRVNKTERYETPGFLSGRIEALVSNYQRNNVGFSPLLNSRFNVRSEDMAIVSPTSFQEAFGSFTAGLYNPLASHSICFIKSSSTELSNAGINSAAAGLLRTWFASLKSIREVYIDLFSLEYIPLQGDWVEVPLDMFQILVTDPSGFLSGGDADATYISHTWMMSPVNFGLKYWGTSETKKHFDGNIQKGPDYLISRVATKSENNKYEIKKLEEVEPEFIGINKDFSKLNTERIYYPLEISYDYCNDCENTFPNRIYYSKKDNLESLTDNYRVFLVNNYRNLDGYGSEIMQLITDKDELYAISKNYTYYVPTRQQEIKTDASIAYIGTGAELSVPPKKLASTNYSYGGSEQPLSVISTEFGTIWVDSLSGKVFRLRDSLEILSSIEMNTFFESELPSVLSKEYRKITGEDYPYSWQLTSSKGIGVISTYDPIYKRLFISKKDYIPIYPFAVQTANKQYGFIYVEDDKFYESTGVEIYLTDTNYFRDNSWTMQFSFEDNKWISANSFLPDFSMNNNVVFYTTKGNKIYRHLTNNYGTYYGVKYPCEIEAILNNPKAEDKTFTSLGIISKNLFSPLDYGVTDLWAYNEEYSTGYLKLKPYTDFGTTIPGEALVRSVTERNTVNHLRDYLTSSPSFESRIKIDRSPINIDINKSNWTKDLITGKYLYVKLRSNKTERLSIDALEYNAVKNIR